MISSALNLSGCDLPLMANPLRIASRRSQLAMVQTNWVRDELIQAHSGLEITIEAMATQGTRFSMWPLPKSAIKAFSPRS